MRSQLSVSEQGMDYLMPNEEYSLQPSTIETIDRAIDVVGSLWNLRNGRNEMRTDET